MARSLNRVIRFLHLAAAPTTGAEPTDGELLRNFVARRDEEAFTGLVRRHGGMVLGVCRRILHDAQDADDAFQATFLVLARKAGSVRKCDSLASWLHGVAFRVARQARRSAARRRTLLEARAMTRAKEADPVDEVARRELRCVLDEELARLPEKYRAPLVLCYLEGKTNDEAARLLGWSKGTLSGRLARARDILRRRLPAGDLGALLAGGIAPPPGLVESTAKAVLAGGASAAAAALAEGVMRAMSMTRLTALVCVGLAALFVAGAGLVGQPRTEKAPTERPGALFGGAGNIAAPAPKEESLDGVWRATHLEEDGVKAPAEEAKKFTLVIKDNEMTINPDTERRRSTFTLDPKARPKRIVVTPQDGPGKGTPVEGIYELQKGKLSICIDRREGTARPREFATSPGSGLALLVLERAASSGEPRTIAGKSAGKLLWGHEGRAPARLAVSPDGKLVAVGSSRGIALLDAGTGKEVREMEGDGIVSAVAFSPDGRRLAVAGAAGGDVKDAGRVRVFDLATGKVVLSLAGESNLVTAVAFTPDAKRLITANDSGGVRIWDAETAKETALLHWHKGSVLALALSPDGRRLVTGGADRNVRQWDLPSGKVVRTLRTLSEVEALAYFPDGSAVVVVLREGSVEVWDTGTDTARYHLPRRSAGARSVAVSPDGKVVAVGAQDSTVTLFTPLGMPLGTLGEHEKSVPSLAFSPDARVLFTADARGNVRAWQLALTP